MEVSGNGFYPRLRLQGPDGSSLGDVYDANGTQSSRVVPVTGMYTVLVSNEFPDSQSGSGSYSLTFSGPPQPSLSINNVTQNEGNSGTTPFTFNVTLSSPTFQTVTVNYATANGTATAPSDYTVISSTPLGFSPADPVTKTVTVLVTGDTSLEPNETFFVNLSGAFGILVSNSQGIGTINNDDSTIQFSSANYSVNENGGPASVIATRTGSGTGVVTALCATSNGTATAGLDYTAVSSTLIWVDGDTAPKTCNVPIIDDNVFEGNETVNLTLSNPTGGSTIGTPNAALLTIVDNDPQPTPTPTPTPTPAPSPTPVTSPPLCGTPTVIYSYDFSNGHLVSFSSAAPSAFITDVDLGFNISQSLIGLDFRPFNGQLYAIVSNGATLQLVTINPATGSVTNVGGTMPVTNDNFFGFDFSPSADVLRIVGDADLNRRINPNDGTLLGNDTTLAYAAGDLGVGTNPNVVHIAHDRNNASAAATTLFGIDSGTNTLVRIGGVDGTPSPNGGQLFTVGSLGVDPTSFGGFDIQGGSNIAYTVLRVSGTNNLYTIDLSTGAVTLLGPAGPGDTLEGIAVGPCSNGATVSGRVLTSDGRGLRNATVSITDSNNIVRTATTSSFGFFSFANVASGGQYVFRVQSRSYRYSPVTVTINDNLTLPDFVGLE